jgi:hypothetical protein
MEAAMRCCNLLTISAFVVLALPATALADSRSEKYRSNGCEVERKVEGQGKMESKVECKPRFDGARFGSGKEEFRRGGCEVKREWKENGEFKEEVKCR